MLGRKNSSKKRKTAVASTVGPIDPKETAAGRNVVTGVRWRTIYIYIIHANKLPSQACSSISEFLCLAGLMEIIFPRNLKASVECNMWGEKGPQITRYIDYCTWAYALRTYAVSVRVFRHPSSETFFFFFLGPVFFFVFNHGLFSFLFFAIHDMQNEHKRKVGVNKSQDVNVNERKRGDMKWTTPDVLPLKTSREALTLTHFNWLIALWRVIEFRLKKLSCW